MPKNKISEIMLVTIYFFPLSKWHNILLTGKGQKVQSVLREKSEAEQFCCCC